MKQTNESKKFALNNFENGVDSYNSINSTSHKEEGVFSFFTPFTPILKTSEGVFILFSPSDNSSLIFTNHSKSCLVQHHLRIGEISLDGCDTRIISTNSFPTSPIHFNSLYQKSLKNFGGKIQ